MVGLVGLDPLAICRKIGNLPKIGNFLLWNFEKLMTPFDRKLNFRSQGLQFKGFRRCSKDKATTEENVRLIIFRENLKSEKTGPKWPRKKDKSQKRPEYESVFVAETCKNKKRRERSLCRAFPPLSLSSSAVLRQQRGREERKINPRREISLAFLLANSFRMTCLTDKTNHPVKRAESQ